MKHPQVYNYGSLIWKQEILESYALYFAKFLEAHARKDSISIRFMSRTNPTPIGNFPRVCGPAIKCVILSATTSARFFKSVVWTRRSGHGDLGRND